MSDQDNLRELVKAAYACRDAGSDVLKIADFWPLVVAAESTLPNTKVIWQLVGWPGNTSLPRGLSAGYDRLADAEAEALKWIRAGGSVTSLRQIEVPA